MNSPLTFSTLNNIHTIAIYGDIGTGKTALAYNIIDKFKGKREVYFIKHPKQELIEKMGYKNLYSLEQMERIENAIIYIDEPQLWLSIYDSKSNSIIAKICSLARQRDLLIIISSSDTRVFTKHNEAYFDAWLVKDVNYPMVKNGSIIKNAIKNVAVLDPEGFRLNVDEFVFWSRQLYEYNGRHRFNKTKEFTEDHSKPYRFTKTAKKVTKGI